MFFDNFRWSKARIVRRTECPDQVEHRLKVMAAHMNCSMEEVAALMLDAALDEAWEHMRETSDLVCATDFLFDPGIVAERQVDPLGPIDRM